MKVPIALSNLNILRKLKNKTYKPMLVKSACIQKPDGAKRLLGIPAISQLLRGLLALVFLVFHLHVFLPFHLVQLPSILLGGAEPVGEALLQPLVGG